MDNIDIMDNKPQSRGSSVFLYQVSGVVYLPTCVQNSTSQHTTPQAHTPRL